MVFLGGTWDKHSDKWDVCLLTLDRGHTYKERVHVGVLWDAGGEVGVEVEVEDADQADADPNEVVVVFLEHSEDEEGGCNDYERGRSKDPRWVTLEE